MGDDGPRGCLEEESSWQQVAGASRLTGAIEWVRLVGKADFVLPVGVLGGPVVANGSQVR